MTARIWRLSHFALAAVTFLFLIVASVTGAILGADAAFRQLNSSEEAKIKDLSVAQTIGVLKKNYTEISDISVDENRNVSINAFDDEGNEVKGNINPATGKFTDKKTAESDFIRDVKSLHRSLFLHETGRFVMGIISCLLLLIVISGAVLIVKRQKGLRYFFAKIRRDFFPQFFHVVSGRILLIPLFITALTGSLLFMNRFKILPEGKPETVKNTAQNLPAKNPEDFLVFNKTKLSDVEKIEFPFAEDPEEFYKLKLKNGEITVNQFSGAVVKEVKNAPGKRLSEFSLDVHTGRTNWLWALVLAIAALNILMFIWSGFAISLRRFKAKLKNKFKPEEAEYIILYGSENGTTANFADKIHRQILSQHGKSYIASLNDYRDFPSAKRLVVFTSTYGLGDPPSSAIRFEELIKKTSQNHEIDFSVVGFGSRSYKDFCAFGEKVDALLSEQKWARRQTNFYTVNDRSAEEFTAWLQDWEDRTQIALVNAPTFYEEKQTKLKSFTVAENRQIDNQNTTILLKFKTNAKFRSGDLLAIYPANDSRERFYSVGKDGKFLQLLVKLHTGGLGSEYLSKLIPGDKIKAKIVENPHFHIPENKSPVLMISNGTGAAPFLGMINENTDQEMHLFCGFRFDNQIAKSLKNDVDSGKISKLKSLQIALSRSENPEYVMDLIRKNEGLVVGILQKGGTLMLCGSLAMQRDVENVLEEIFAKHKMQPLEFYRENRQLLTDCY